MDFFRVTTTTSQNVTFKLQTLPKNYNLETYTGTGFFLAGSYATGNNRRIRYAVQCTSRQLSFQGIWCNHFRLWCAEWLPAVKVVLAAPTTSSLLTQSSKEEMMTTGLLSVYPNPAADRIVLHYSSPVAATAVIEVFDNMNQRVLTQQQLVSCQAGQLQLNCSAGRQVSTLLKLNTGNQTAVKKVIVTH